MATPPRSPPVPSAFWPLVAAVIVGGFQRALTPTTWRSPVVTVLLQQIYFTGVGALTAVVASGLITGWVLVLSVGDVVERLAPLSAPMAALVEVLVIQHFAPLLVNLIIISRSATAITAELASAIVAGEMDLLLSQGVDPLEFVILPRLLGVTVAALGLLWVLFAALVVGELLGNLWYNPQGIHPIIPVRAALTGVEPGLLWLVGGKTALGALGVAAVCCVSALEVAPAITEIPKAVTRAVMRALVVLFLAFILVTLLLTP
ncbi:MAG: ABC transporter permease [Candidatus Competibacterales bacterium]